MVAKRSLEQTKMAVTRPRRENAKRTKLSPPADRRSDSSNLSRGSISEDSALQSSDLGSQHRSMSSVSSVESVDDDGEGSSEESSSTMSAGKSSSDSESDSEADGDGDDVEPIVTIGGPKKPRMDHVSVLGGARDLRSRLASFLPQMERANGLLGSNDKMEKDDESDDDDGEQRIEMNLGLGVLEEKGHGNTEDDSDSDVSSSSEHSSRALESQSRTESANGRKDEDVMGKLLGSKTTGKSLGIEEVG